MVKLPTPEFWSQVEKTMLNVFIAYYVKEWCEKHHRKPFQAFKEEELRGTE